MDSVVVVSSRPRWKTVHAPNRTRETARERERGGGGGARENSRRRWSLNDNTPYGVLGQK